MAASCAGANVKKVNRFYDDPVPGGGALYDSNYDSYIAFVYPSGMEYSDIPPGSSIFNAIDMNHLAIMRTMDIYSESGNDGDHNAPIEAVRYCGVKANYTPIYEAKYGNSLDISSNPFFDSLGSAALATKLRNIAKLYVIFPFMPGTIKTNSCFAFECGDFVEQRFYVNGIYDHGRYHILTSINISSMSTMSIKSPGKYERDTSETGSNTQSQTTRAMQAGQISKLNDQVAALEKYINVGNNSLGIGEPAATSNIPANGRADFGMDVYLNNRAYLGGNQLKYTTHQYLRSTSQLSSAGWYRFAKWDIQSNSNVRGGAGILVDVTIATQYQANSNCIHKISLLGAYDKIAFVDETSVSVADRITKIRYIRNSANEGAIDVYYNLSTANYARADIAAHFANAFYICDFLPVNPVVEGETVVTEYTFSANYNADDAIFYKAGDTATFSYVVMPAGIYNSSKQVTMTLNLPKRLDKVLASRMTITEFKAILTGVNGTVGNTSLSYDWLADTNLTLGSTSPWKVSSQALGITFNATTAWSNAVNRSPASVYASSVKISFA